TMALPNGFRENAACAPSATTATKSIVIGDSQPLCLQGILSILAAQPDLKVVATCQSLQETALAVRSLGPDIVILGLSIRELCEAGLAQTAGAGQAPKVILLTPRNEQPRDVFAAGAAVSGVVSKLAPVEDLLTCVRTVAAGGIWMPRNAANSDSPGHHDERV